MVTMWGQAYSTAALTAGWSVLYLFRLIAVMLLMLGLFARQSRKMGVFGVAAFLIASIGTTLVAGFAWTLTFTFPAMAESVPAFLDALAAAPSLGIVLTLFMVTAGWILFGAASLRARVLPVGAAWLVMVGSLLALVLEMMKLPMSWLVFDIAQIWMGWWLWKERITQ